MASSGYPDNWYDHPMYARYWQHYHQAMSWYQKHQQAYNKAMAAAYGPMMFPAHHMNFPTHLASRQRKVGGGSKEPEQGVRSRSGSEKEEEDSSGESGSEIECDVTNMEISQELREFFAQTERHREELKKQQEEEAVRHEAYVAADQDLHEARQTDKRSKAPPLERPGERRNAEMKRLYGENAPRIQAMETAMQLNFDRNCDRLQPKYWPVIPLKL
ncbi:gem-associated protein 8 [Engraulis encrasicolus]|uniref:gem-associated protein 8 n=1 Tax=Engraulis encrasicolus TaxID=184585 RepID=UPI002FD0E951